MALGDIFKSKENDQLKNRIAELEALLTPEMQDHIKLKEQIDNRRRDLEMLQLQITHAKQEYDNAVSQHQSELFDWQNRIASARAELVETSEEALMQSFGIYKPHYSFANSSAYKDALDQVRQKQKDSIKAGTAVTGNNMWSVNGDITRGTKMIKDMQKLVLRCFNCECDDVIDHVKFNSMEAAEKRIDNSFVAISKLGAMCGVAITNVYKNLKLQELHLAYEYQVEKQIEKEQLKQLRADERERAKLEKEIAEARKQIEKEQKHYSNALAKINQQIAAASPDEIDGLLAKKAEFESHLEDLAESIQQIDYREANQKAGYVYIISNIGAFGEGIYKIGMTRRLEPMDRVDELGDASVPFDFDVHALIFSDDAPALEAALHRAFEDRKVNMVNARREFFRVSLDEIKTVIRKNYDKTVEFVDVAPAEQYRESLKLQETQHLPV